MFLISLITGDSKTRPFLLEWRCAKPFIIFVVSFSTFTDIFLYSVVVPVLPFALHERAGVPDDDRQYWVSILLAVYGAALFTVSPVLGWVADRIQSRRLPFLAGLITLTGATVFLCLGNSTKLLIIGRILQGFSAAIVWTVGLALLVDTVGKGQAVGAALGYIGLSLSLGVLVGPILGGIVFDKGGYYAVFYMCFGLLGFDIFCRLAMIERKVAKKWIPELDSREPSIMSMSRPNTSHTISEETVVDGKHSSSTLRSSPNILEKPLDADSYRTGNTSQPSFLGDNMADSRLSHQLRDAHSSSTDHLNAPPSVIKAPSNLSTILEKPKTLGEQPSLQDTVPRASAGVQTAGPKFRLPPIITLLGSRRLVAALCASMVQAVTLTALDSTIPLRTRSVFGWNSLGAGIIFLAIAVPSFVSPLIGTLSDRYGPKWFCAAGFLLACPFFVLLRLIDHNTLSQKAILVVFLVGLGISLSVALTPAMAEIAYCVGAKEAKAPGSFGKNGAYAQAYALFNMAFAAGCLIGPIWGGMIKEAIGWGNMCLTLGLLSAVAAIPCALFTGGWILDKEKWQRKGENRSAEDGFHDFDGERGVDARDMQDSSHLDDAAPYPVV